MTTTPAPRIPRWTVWAVLAGLAVTVVVSLLVDAASDTTSLDGDDLTRYLLQAADVPGLALIGEFGTVDASLDPQSGANATVSSAFADFDGTASTAAEAARGWSSGRRVVISEVLTFESPAEANEYLGSIWSTYARGALERQRGPDGSLLIFHPEFEGGAAAPTAPVAVASWVAGSDLLVIRYVGAKSASEVLELARIVEARHTGGGA